MKSIRLRLTMISTGIMLIAAGSTQSLDAQSILIQGRSVDNDTGSPLDGVRIHLVNDTLAVVMEATTDAQGAFTLRAPNTGLFALRSSKTGYRDQQSLPFELVSGIRAQVTFRISSSTILLDPAEVTLEPDDSPPDPLASVRTINRGPSEGEVIRGTTVDDGTGNFIGQVRIELLDEDEEGLEETTSNAVGGFYIRAPRPGTYLIRGSRLGYREQKSFPFVLARGDRAIADFRLSADAILLDPLTVSVESLSTNDLFMAEFYEREQFFGRSGRGNFFHREDLEPLTGMPLAVAVSSLEGRFYVGSAPGRGNVIQTVVSGRICEPFIFFDGFRVRGIEDIPLDALATVQSLGAVEIYRGSLNVPAELWDTALSAPCAAIVFWRYRGGD